MSWEQSSGFCLLSPEAEAWIPAWTLLSLCLYNFCKRVIWLLSRLCTMLTFLCERKKKNPWKLLPHNIVCPLISLDLLIWPFKLYQQIGFLQNWTNTNKSNNDQTYLLLEVLTEPPWPSQACRPCSFIRKAALAMLSRLNIPPTSTTPPSSWPSPSPPDFSSLVTSSKKSSLIWALYPRVSSPC